jgi:hypothetical protein
MAKAQALFKQMCGENVTQGVDRDFFLIPIPVNEFGSFILGA